MPEKDFKELKNKGKPLNLSKPAGVKEKVISLLAIYTLIARNLHLSIADLIERCKVSERCIYRYLEIIKQYPEQTR